MWRRTKEYGKQMTQQYPKRLIEVDLPIKRISAHSRREKSIRHGHISTLHIWWARRPLAACRAVICAALWPDPADPLCPQDFRDKASKLITNSPMLPSPTRLSARAAITRLGSSGRRW
jgi:adenine-specific DNA methylase